jgi:NAD(P)-dependent dehydrogenase (short-subunit alcohol dehydrogenase family)
MDYSTTTALVTGANRGLGLEFAKELLARGAKVYAGARNPDSITLDGVIPLRIDTTDPASIAAAADLAPDVTLLVNNAGISRDVDLLHGDLDDARAELETNYLGPLQVIRAFAPALEGGGAILNVLSVLSWLSSPSTGGYSASKAAAWSMTNAIRPELQTRGITVTALHVGLMATDMAADFTGPKSDPAAVARLALDGVAAGAYEVLADDLSRTVQAGLAGGVTALYPGLAA